MKDIPVFTTENGAASLILREVPYRHCAYIRLQASCQPEALLDECVSFCRACGAERIYAQGDAVLEGYPFHTDILRMQCPTLRLEPAAACLFPVTEATAKRWQEIYNQKMENVPNGAYMDSRDVQEMLQKGDGYFIHRDRKLLGIGRASDGTIHALASMVPGAGETVVRALAELLGEEMVSLQVASENHKAVALYQRLGFVRTQVLSSWYRVFG